MRKGGIIAIIIIAVLVIAAVIGFVIYNNSQSGTTSTSNMSFGGSGSSSGSGLSFEENQEEEIEIIRGVAMPGWEAMEIPANTTEVTVDLFNPEENDGYFYLTFEIKLDDTGETLYKSGLVKAGDHVRKITLSRALEPGTYNATMIIKPYTADDKMTEKNNGQVAFKLVAVEV